MPNIVLKSVQDFDGSSQYSLENEAHRNLVARVYLRKIISQNTKALQTVVKNFGTNTNGDIYAIFNNAFNNAFRKKPNEQDRNIRTNFHNYYDEYRYAASIGDNKKPRPVEMMDLYTLTCYIHWQNAFVAYYINHKPTPQPGAIKDVERYIKDYIESARKEMLTNVLISGESGAQEYRQFKNFFNNRYNQSSKIPFGANADEIKSSLLAADIGAYSGGKIGWCSLAFYNPYSFNVDDSLVDKTIDFLGNNSLAVEKVIQQYVLARISEKYNTTSRACELWPGQTLVRFDAIEPSVFSDNPVVVQARLLGNLSQMYSNLMSGNNKYFVKTPAARFGQWQAHDDNIKFNAGIATPEQEQRVYRRENARHDDYDEDDEQDNSINVKSTSYFTLPEHDEYPLVWVSTPYGENLHIGGKDGEIYHSPKVLVKTIDQDGQEHESIENNPCYNHTNEDLPNK